MRNPVGHRFRHSISVDTSPIGHRGRFEDGFGRPAPWAEYLWDRLRISPRNKVWPPASFQGRYGIGFLNV